MVKVFRLRNVVIMGSVAIAGVYVDTYLNGKAFQRTTRALWSGLVIGFNYKWDFKPGADFDALHTRVAERILSCCKQNGGLYIKFGQAIASMNSILPPQYNKTFRVLYDDAPAVPYEDLAEIFEEDFHKSPAEIFLHFETTPVASASIGQVHKAVLKDGTVVAVKVQKPYIQKQLEWDLFAYKVMVYTFEKCFDLPLYWTVDYMCKHLRQEVDFENEGRNSEKAAKHLTQMKKLDVYIPKVHWEFTSKRILTAEWIDGIRFTDIEAVKKAGFDVKQVMNTIVSMFSYQIFMTGFLHCDPHPGNIIIRKSPNTKFLSPFRKQQGQVVLLDHGLYVQESPAFRDQYCKFWRALFTRNMTEGKKICEEWGIKDFNMFASASLQKPFNPDKAVHLLNQNISFADYEMQMASKERARDALSDTSKIPKEILFVGRNMNLVRSNNKYLGSPVNRINIMANWAVAGLDSDWHVWDKNGEANTFFQKARNIVRASVNYWSFRSTLFLMSVTFYASNFWKTVNKSIFGRNVGGFEEILDNRMKNTLKDQYGIVVDVSNFDA